ncbi:MAG: DUF4383 domain-containing protein [Actinomycetota bacterium]|nr:DUF4383 domain-containing protein [Actinomycetota bacterium]
MLQTARIPPNRHLPLTYNQMFGYLFGLVYLSVGAAGFAATKGINLTATVGGRELHWFSVNPLHNFAHLAVGGLLMFSAFAGPKASRGVNLIVGSVYLLLAIAGPIVTGSSANILSLNLSDDLLHLATALLAIGTAVVLGARDELQPA